jgi:F-type H+-transporting ATPase subunit b
MLDPSISTFLITIINIGFLFFVLRAVLFRPVSKFIEDRKKKVQDSIHEAENDRQTAKTLLQQYEDRLKAVQEEADGILKSAQKTARQQADQIIAEGKAEADRLRDNARKQIETERRAALALFQAEAAALVIQASSRLLQRELNQEDNRRFAGLLLQEIGK